MRLGPSADLFGLTEATSNFCSPIRNTSTWARRRGAFKHANGNWSRDRADRRDPEHESFGDTKRIGAAMIHDRFDPALQIGAGDAGDAHQRRFDRKPARSENAFGINLRFAATAQHILVAGALTLLHEPRTNPPDQRMKPEHGLHAHLQPPQSDCRSGRCATVRARGSLRSASRRGDR